MTETANPTFLERYESLDSIPPPDDYEPATPQPPVQRTEPGLPNHAIDRLTETLERMWKEPRPPTRTVKPPQYDGQGDVEYFLKQFTTVSEANEWNGVTELLQLRESLKGTAKS
jgi:hypothetical protein